MFVASTGCVQGVWARPSFYVRAGRWTHDIPVARKLDPERGRSYLHLLRRVDAGRSWTAVTCGGAWWRHRTRRCISLLIYHFSYHHAEHSDVPTSDLCSFKLDCISFDSSTSSSRTCHVIRTGLALRVMHHVMKMRTAHYIVRAHWWGKPHKATAASCLSRHKVHSQHRVRFCISSK